MDNSDFNELSLLSWDSGQTKEEFSHNHYNNFNDENLLLETNQEYDDIMGNTKTESTINDEIDEDVGEIKNNNEIEKELDTNIEIIIINNPEEKKNFTKKENLNINNNKNFILNNKEDNNEEKFKLTIKSKCY